eukprot:GHVL01032401.1.p1 GENE.GHVL01032401.1~~GHVL01032401.1.p1  ORF type:complete len:636 (+),score=128.69 GHVL01032401.1:27-1934(+)
MATIQKLTELRKQKEAELLAKKAQVEELQKKRNQVSSGVTDSKSKANQAVSKKDASSGNVLDVDKILKEILSDTGTAAIKTDVNDSSMPRNRQSCKVTCATEINIPPKTAEFYDKSIQSESPRPSRSGSLKLDEKIDVPVPQDSPNVTVASPVEDTRHRRTSSLQKSIQQRSKQRTVVAQEVHGNKDPTAVQNIAEAEIEIEELEPEEQEKIIQKNDFQEFFNNTTKMVERALGYKFDVLVDYSGISGSSQPETGGAETLQICETYYNDQWCEGRPVTDVRPNPMHQEVFLASYGQKVHPNVTDPDGVVLVWSLPMSQRPEFRFTCQSAVLTALFDKFQPHLLVGGTYSGTIILWDTRAKSGPVQRTPLSSRGHSHPVFCLQLVGTQNAHNLVSISTDGRLCVWSLAMLVHPQEFIDFKRGNKDVAVTSAAFAEGETNCLYAGAEDSTIYQAHIHGHRVGVNDQEKYDSHEGPLTSVDFHPSGEGAQYGTNFTGLLLSSSLDWTVKLWDPKQYQTPLLSFDTAEDYVFDAKWHPSHPALFASSWGDGNVDLWHLNKDFEAPYVTVPTGESAVNHLCWTGDGRKLITGDAVGKVSTWSLDKELVTAKPEEYSKLEERVADLKPQAAAPSSSSKYAW